MLIYVYCEIFKAVTTHTSVAVGRPHPQPRSDLLTQDAAPTHDHVALAPRSPVWYLKKQCISIQWPNISSCKSIKFVNYHRMLAATND